MKLNLQFKIRITNTKLTKWKFERLQFLLNIVRYPNLPELTRCYPILPDVARALPIGYWSLYQCSQLLNNTALYKKQRKRNFINYYLFWRVEAAIPELLPKASPGRDDLGKDDEVDPSYLLSNAQMAFVFASFRVEKQRWCWLTEARIRANFRIGSGR